MIKYWITISRWQLDAIRLMRELAIAGGVTKNDTSLDLAAFQVIVDELKGLVNKVRKNTGKKIEKT